MEQPKEYKIMSFNDLCDVINSENKDRLLADLTLAFNDYVTTIEAVRKIVPGEVESKTNSEIAEFGFTWIDDGKHERHGVTVQSGNLEFKVTKK